MPQIFITTLYYMHGFGYVAPYMYQYGPGSVLIVEICYDLRTYGLKEVRMRMPPGMMEVTPEMLKNEKS